MFILALVCATISTMAALLHTMGSSAGYDLWGQIKERRGEKMKNMDRATIKSLRASRISTQIMMVLVVLVAYLMPSNIIARATTIFMGLTAAAVLPSFAYGLFSKNPDKRAAHVSIAVGAVSWTIWAFFVERTTSGMMGVCQALFGVKYLSDGIYGFIDPLVIGLPLSALALIVSLLVIKAIGKTPAPVAE